MTLTLSVEFTYTTTALACMQSNDAQYFRQYVFYSLADGIGWEVTGYADGAGPVSSIPQPQGLSDLSSPPLAKTIITARKKLSTVGSQPTFLPGLFIQPLRLTCRNGALFDLDLYWRNSTHNSIADQSYSEVSLDVDPTTQQ